MRWKFRWWQIPWGVITALSMIFGSLKDASQFFLSLFIVGYNVNVDEVTRIQITLLVLGSASLGVLLLYIRKTSREKKHETLRKDITRMATEYFNGNIFGDKDPRLAHLTIYFSNKTDTPDTPNPAFGRYVVNNRKKLARWVSTLLEPHIKNHRMNWHTFKNREETLAYFTCEKFDVKEQDATPEELDISTDFK